MAHTPGPWESQVPTSSSHTTRFVVAVDEGTGERTHICKVGHMDFTAGLDADLANARLIAAAPDLLAALRGVLDCPQAAPWLARLSLADGTPVWDAVCAAIAKAEGRE